MILIIILTGITTYTSQKTILESYGVGDGGCQTDLNRFNFYINAELRGNLTQSMFKNYTINVKSNYSLKVNCDFPEINSSEEYIMYISIYCYTEIIEDIEFSFSFEGTSNELELINFNENFLYLKIHCPEYISLILGEIKDQECRQYDSYINYIYKITILNETLPDNLYLNNINLQPNISGNNDAYKNYYTRCNLVKNDSNNYFECSMEYSRIFDETIYYETNYTYKTWSNDYTIIIKNTNENLYIGENIICYNEPKINYLDIIKGKCKNGAFLFSIDFNDYIIDNDENSENNKILFEIKAEIDSKTSKNYCYLDNGNEDDEFNIAKYKLNCAFPSFDE